MGCFILNVFSGKDKAEINEGKETGRNGKRGRVDEPPPPVIDLTSVSESLDSLNSRLTALEKDKEEKDQKRRRRDTEIEITQTEEKDICEEVLRVFIFVICELVLMHSLHQLLEQHKKFFYKEYNRKSAAPFSLDPTTEIMTIDKALNVLFVTKRVQTVHTIRFHHSMACTHT